MVLLVDCLFVVSLLSAGRLLDDLLGLGQGRELLAAALRLGLEVLAYMPCTYIYIYIYAYV